MPEPRAKSRWLPALLLFLAVLLTFLRAVKNDFVNYDDPEYVTANVHIKNGLTWDSIQWAFAAHGSNWHPVTCLSHILDGQLFGLRPWGHHLGSVLLHAANTALVFVVFFQFTAAKWRSFFIALLFGLHPLRVESVAWVSERKDVLSGFFFLLTLLAYGQYVSAARISGAKSKIYYVLALFLFALGLMSKSMLVTTPCVLLLVDCWPLNRIAERGVRSAESGPPMERFEGPSVTGVLLEKGPFFLLAALFSVIAYRAQLHGSAMGSEMAPGLRIANALISYCRYLGKIFWPAGLSPLYPFPQNLPLGEVCAAAAFLVCVSLLVFLLRRKQPALLVGWLWFLGMLVPVIGLVKIGEQSIADRYTYLPSLGIMLMLVWGIGDLIQNSRPASVVIPNLGLGCGAVCAVLAWRQIAFWRNTEAMFQRAVDTTLDNTLADVGLGVCLAARGEVDEAIRLYRHSLAVSPHYFESHYNLGQALVEQGKFDEAIAAFRAALQDRPGVADAHISLGAALAKAGRKDEALAQLQEAARLNPADPLPHDNLAKLLSSDPGRVDEAIEQFELASKLQPNNAARQSDLGALLLNRGRCDEAIAREQEAIKLDPANADAHNNLGTALGMKGRLADAIAQFQTAVKLNPNHAQAKKNLARALEMKQTQQKAPASSNDQ